MGGGARLPRAPPPPRLPHRPPPPPPPSRLLHACPAVCARLAEAVVAVVQLRCCRACYAHGRPPTAPSPLSPCRPTCSLCPPGGGGHRRLQRRRGGARPQRGLSRAHGVVQRGCERVPVPAPLWERLGREACLLATADSPTRLLPAPEVPCLSKSVPALVPVLNRWTSSWHCATTPWLTWHLAGPVPRRRQPSSQAGAAGSERGSWERNVQLVQLARGAGAARLRRRRVQQGERGAAGM